MLKIVDIHPSSSATGEYVVLQNQGLQTVSLRGWTLCTDAFFCGDLPSAAQETYVFAEDVPIKPYTRVVFFTGAGDSGWYPTTDGKWAYVVFWGRSERVWTFTDNIHLLHVTCSRKVISPLEATVPTG